MIEYAEQSLPHRAKRSQVAAKATIGPSFSTAIFAYCEHEGYMGQVFPPLAGEIYRW
jgi:hypothetical protein